MNTYTFYIYQSPLNVVPGVYGWKLVGFFESQGLSDHPHHAAREGRAPGADLSLCHGLSTADLLDSAHLEVIVLGLDATGAHHLCHLILRMVGMMGCWDVFLVSFLGCERRKWRGCLKLRWRVKIIDGIAVFKHNVLKYQNFSWQITLLRVIPTSGIYPDIFLHST